MQSPFRCPLCQVLAVDGNSTEGWDNETVTKYLRGSEGSAVVVEVGRPRPGSVSDVAEDLLQVAEPDQIPGLAGRRLEPYELERKRFRWGVRGPNGWGNGRQD